MVDPLGCRRLLARETNVSDLLQYLTDRDPTPWAALAPGTVGADREARIGATQSADLILRDIEGTATGGVEVKLGYTFDGAQAEAYEKTLDERIPLLLAGLDTDAVSAGAARERWQFVHLSTLVSTWTSSKDTEAAAVACAAARVLTHWDETTSAVLEIGGHGAPLAAIQEPFLARVVTRALETRLHERRELRTLADVTLGGGNATLMAFSRIPDERPGREFIGEIRWSIPKQTMVLRLGLDYPRGSREERQAVWDAALRMDDVIAADRFISHVAASTPVIARTLSSKGAGRPRRKGNWNDIIEKGFESGDAKNYNPGFHRDRDTRFEAMAQVDLSQASGVVVESLLTLGLDYLAEHWRPAGSQS